MQEKNNSKIGPFRHFFYFSNLKRERVVWQKIGSLVPHYSQEHKQGEEEEIRVQQYTSDRSI